MLIRLLCAHDMTKHMCEISHLNSKRLLRKLQKILGGYFILPHPVDVISKFTTQENYDIHSTHLCLVKHNTHTHTGGLSNRQHL